METVIQGYNCVKNQESHAQFTAPTADFWFSLCYSMELTHFFIDLLFLQCNIWMIQHRYPSQHRFNWGDLFIH